MATEYNNGTDPDIDLLIALDYIDPSTLTYAEWLAVGMDLYANGYDVDTWDNWSRSDPRYKNNDCSVRWRSFGSDITGGTIIGMAIKNGYNPNQNYDDAIERGARRHFKNFKTRNVDPNDAIDDFTENPVKWELTPEIEKAHKRLLEGNNADYVTVEHDGKNYNISPLTYLMHVRKIPLEFIKNKKIGYAIGGHNDILERYPEYKSYDGKNTQLHKIILPYSNGNGGFNYYLSETIDRNAQLYAGTDENGDAKYRKPEKYKKPNKDNETVVTLEDGTTERKPATVPTVKAEIYNEYLLRSPAPNTVIFVVEGIYDALSVEIAGGNAIAFVGTAHKRFLSICKTFRPNALFVIALDNDTSGNNAVTRVIDGLTTLGLRYIRKQAPAPYKDFNECLQKDPELLKQYVTEIGGTSNAEQRFNQLLTALETPPKENNAFNILNQQYKATKKRRK